MGSAISAERLDLRRGDRVAVWRCEPGNWQPRHRKAIRVVLCLVALASQTQRGVLGSARTSFGECLPPLQCMVLLLLLLTGLSLIDRSDDGSGASSGASAGLQRRCWPRQSLHGLQGRRRRGGAALRSVRCWRGLGRGWTGGLPGDGEACLAPWRLRRGEPPPGPDGEDRRAASWHWAYRTAEESAGVITVRDICGDFDGFPRVWAIHRCPPPFLGKQEAVFRRDGQRELHCVGQRGWHTWIGWHPAFLQSEARGGHLRGAALRRGLEAGTASLRPRGVLLRVSGPAGRRRLGGVGRQHAATPAVTCAFVC
mmetsp:Transcript_29890/g.94212  ORF Transcript_29890/g.94212 Transcript_29890/m.94212 type:complete len:311 (-) Transcript_29890:65-997(-)